LAITSVSKSKKYLFQLKSSQFRYALIYVVITLAVLIFLNIYSSKRSYELFYSSKEVTMLEKCRTAANEIENVGVLNHQTVSGALSRVELATVSHTVVTDSSGKLIYDSASGSASVDGYALYPEIIQALKGNDIFTWHYADSQMQSKAVIPIYSYGQLTGCVYSLELDHQQGILIGSLQSNMFTITVALAVVIILFSLFFATVYSGRLRKIMASIRNARTGDYSNKIDMSGDDELTALSDEFNDLIKRLQRSERKRTQFVSDASHELKTPLASIKLLTDSILQNPMDPDTVKEFVGDIGNEADRLNRMSQKLLSLAKTDDATEIACEIMYISPTIEKVCRMLQAVAVEQHITITVDIEKDSTVLMQEDDLYQIIFNLVENGIKYNKTHGNLMISLSSDKDFATIKIQDTGVGIPEDSLEHIFERFYRVDKARSRSTGGSGLGLSIVRSMVERNKGEIHVSSQLDVGTTFILSFPIFDMEDRNNED
jgi:signal transduction histidine kinase